MKQKNQRNALDVGIAGFQTSLTQRPVLIANVMTGTNKMQPQTTIDNKVEKELREAEIVSIHQEVFRNGGFDYHLYLNELRPLVEGFMQDYPSHSEEYEHMLTLYDPLAWDIEEVQEDVMRID